MQSDQSVTSLFVTDAFTERLSLQKCICVWVTLTVAAYGIFGLVGWLLVSVARLVL